MAGSPRHEACHTCRRITQSNCTQEDITHALPQQSDAQTHTGHAPASKGGHGVCVCVGGDDGNKAWTPTWPTETTQPNPAPQLPLHELQAGLSRGWGGGAWCRRDVGDGHSDEGLAITAVICSPSPPLYHQGWAYIRPQAALPTLT